MKHCHPQCLRDSLALTTVSLTNSSLLVNDDGFVKGLLGDIQVLFCYCVNLASLTQPSRGEDQEKSYHKLNSHQTTCSLWQRMHNRKSRSNRTAVPPLLPLLRCSFCPYSFILFFTASEPTKSKHSSPSSHNTPPRHHHDPVTLP